MASKQEILQRCRAALGEHCRFKQMESSLETWATKWSTETLGRWLHLDHLPLIEREKALVALALQATDRAGVIIDAYDPYHGGEEHELFYKVARLEWEQRHRTRWRPAA